MGVKVKWVSGVLMVFLWSLPAWAFDPFGETGYFLTPTTDVVGLKNFSFGVRFLDWPTSGDDLIGGGLVAGVGRNWEVGWGVASWEDEDINSFSVKYRFYHDRKTKLTLAGGGAWTIRGGGGRQESDQDPLAYFVASIPYIFGTLHLGAMWLDDAHDVKTVTPFGSVDYDLYPDLKIFYEVTGTSRISRRFAHHIALQWKPSEKYPLFLQAGAVISEFVPARGTDTVFTAGLSILYSEKLIEKFEQIEE
ncbi:MAG: hypothetical protein V2G33_01840 [bacterium JZ-2024 1]